MKVRVSVMGRKKNKFVPLKMSGCSLLSHGYSQINKETPRYTFLGRLFRFFSWI